MHRNLTLGLGNSFLRPVLAAAFFLAASLLMAQDTNLSNYQGPGILSRGVGDVGSRSGEQLNLRFYAGVSGIMDTNLAPFARDAQGNLLRIHNLYGIELAGGAYGVHSWKRSQLGLDYRGTYRRYLNVDTYRGSDQALTLGFTHQVSRRLAFDLRESVGTISLGTSRLASAASSDPASAFNPTTLLFDSRTNYLQSSAYATYTQSARMSYTAGGTAFLQDRKSLGLSNSWGYDFTGSMVRRMSKAASLGVTYAYSHFEFPTYQTRSDSNTLHAFFASALGRFWTISIEAGATGTHVDSVFSVALTDPNLVALFGGSIVPVATSFRTYYPSGSAVLKRRFRSAALAFNYYRGVNSGNGVYTTARMENATVSISYTGVRRLNAGLNGGFYKVAAIGQNLGNYGQFSAGAGFTYNLGHAIHLSANYDFRDQQIDSANYRRSSSRATLGLFFSPGTLPLALW